MDIETIKMVAQSLCSGDQKCPDCSPQCGVWNYAIKALTRSKECVHCINPYQTLPYNYCPYCGRGLGKYQREKQKNYVDPLDLTPSFCPCCGEKVWRGWISVDDRLPENGVICLLCCDVKLCYGTHRQYICDGLYAEKYKKLAHGIDDDCVTDYNEENDQYYISEGWYEVINNWDDYDFIAISDTVTHWMPLPEPPKMKGGAE